MNLIYLGSVNALLQAFAFPLVLLITKVIRVDVLMLFYKLLLFHDFASNCVAYQIMC